jgi:hypothetical protein
MGMVLQKGKIMVEFLKLFHSLCKDCKSNRQAYEQAEEIYITLHKKRKYKNYNTFTVSLNRYFRKKKKKYNIPSA